MKRNLRVNLVEEKQLLKKLNQLNVEEARNRKKYDRLSTDLIYFLKQNRETTGYLSKNYSKNAKKYEIEHHHQESVEILEDESIIVGNNKKLIRPQTAIPSNIRQFEVNKKDKNTCGTSTPINSNHNENEIVRMLSPIELTNMLDENQQKNKKTQKFKEEFDKERLRPHTANPNLIIKTNKIKDETKSNSTQVDATPPLKFIPSSKEILLMKTLETPTTMQKDSTIKISTNNRYLVNNNKIFKGKFTFDFIDNTKIKINMSKNYMRKVKTRIMYENKVNENAEFLASLHKMQTAFDFKVKQFSETIII
jgi:hypothetical protein